MNKKSSLFGIAFSSSVCSFWGGGCASDVAEDTKGYRTITADDVESMAPGSFLDVEVSSGGVRVNNTDGNVDLSRIRLVDSSGTAHPLVDVALRKFDRQDLRHVLTFEELEHEIVPSYLLNSYLIAGQTDGPDSTWWKSPSWDCTSNRYLLGMGAKASPMTNILFRGMIPHNSGSLPFRAESAYHANLAGAPTNWSAVSYTICANAPGGLSTVQASSANNSTSHKSVSITCAGGRSVLGMGGTIIGGDGRVKVDGIVPIGSPPYAVELLASEDPTGTTGNWYARVHAICAHNPGGLQLVTTSSPPIGTPSVPLSCPAGKVLTGLGGSVNTATRTNVGLAGLEPTNAGGTNAVVSFASYGSLPSGTVTGYGICADLF